MGKIIQAIVNAIRSAARNLANGTKWVWKMVTTPFAGRNGEATQEAQLVAEQANDAVAEAEEAMTSGAEAVAEAKAAMEGVSVSSEAADQGGDMNMARALYAYCRARAAEGTPREFTPAKLSTLAGALGPMADAARNLPTEVCRQVGKSGKSGALSLLNDLHGFRGGPVEDVAAASNIIPFPGNRAGHQPMGAILDREAEVYAYQPRVAM